MTLRKIRGKPVAALIIAAFLAPAFPSGAYAAPGDTASAQPAVNPVRDRSTPVAGSDFENGDGETGSTTGGGVSDGDVEIPGAGIPDGGATENPTDGGITDGGAAKPEENKPTAPAGVTTQAAWSKCAVVAPQTAQAGVAFKIRLVGDRQDEKGKYDGETKFVPASWEIRGAPFGSYASEKPFTTPYESVVNLKNAGTYTLSAKYRSFTYTSGAGWTEDVSDFEYVKTATVTVPLTIVFNARGGTVQRLSGQYHLTEKCGTLPAPARRKYRFLGWYRTPEGKAADLVRKGDSVAMLNTSRAASVTLYAHYGKSVKVRFNANGGKMKKKSKSVSYVTAYEKKAYGKLPKPRRKGYYFAGWYTKKKGGRYVSAYSEVRSKNNLTLYAHWVR